MTDKYADKIYNDIVEKIINSIHVVKDINNDYKYDIESILATIKSLTLTVQ